MILQKDLFTMIFIMFLLLLLSLLSVAHVGRHDEFNFKLPFTYLVSIEQLPIDWRLRPIDRSVAARPLGDSANGLTLIVRYPARGDAFTIFLNFHNIIRVAKR
uniref:Putative secreted peptide n=1 Tax=Anopheles braziliensis TaxID=58242 RepID=A0A2M3ZSD5_9DIPT